MHTPLPQHRKINKWAFISQGGTSFKRCFLSLSADRGATTAPPSRCWSCAWGLPAVLSPQRAGEGAPSPRAPRSFPAPAFHLHLPPWVGSSPSPTSRAPVLQVSIYLAPQSGHFYFYRTGAAGAGRGGSELAHPSPAAPGRATAGHLQPPPATSLAPARAGALWRCHVFSLGSGRSPAARADGDVGAHSCWHVSPWQQHSEGVGAGRRSRAGSSPALVVLALQGREQGVRCCAQAGSIPSPYTQPRQPHLHFAVYPAEELRHTCVDPRLVLLATSRAPARHPGHVPAAVVLADQGPSTVTLAEGGRKVRKSRQLCAVSLSKDPVPPAHLARILPPLQVPSAHHARGQVALVHLVAVADLVVNELHLGLPQLWGGVFCKAEEPWGRVSLVPPLPPGPSNHSRIVPAPCRCWGAQDHAVAQPASSLTFVLPGLPEAGDEAGPACLESLAVHGEAGRAHLSWREA